MKAIQKISLWIIGLTFIFSGFVKAIDPVGGAIQITDYMYAFHIEFLKSLATFFAISLATIEFLIGAHLILQLRIKIIAWPMIALMSFFTCLTLYIAIFNPVSDCGCFGEAVKLTNWQTFTKNIILLPFAIFIFLKRNEIQSTITSFRSWVLTILHLLFIVSISSFALYDSPIFDFRPFKIGINIPHAMSIPQGAEQPQYDTRFIMEKNGIQKEFNDKNYPYNDSTWVFINSKTTIIKEGYQPAIKDFNLTTPDQTVATELVLNAKEPVFLMISSKLSLMDTSNVSNLIKLSYIAQEKGFHFYCLTASDNENIQKFKLKHGGEIDYLIADETTIKTIIRSNPGLVLIINGTIIGKWNANRIEDVSIFENPLEGALTLLRQRNDALMLFTCFFFILAGTSIIFRFKS